MLVKKACGSPRICVAFTHLIDAFSKRLFPLPYIDQFVDAITGFSLMSFINAYFGYYQIKMHLEDEEKKIFRHLRR